MKILQEPSAIVYFTQIQDTLKYPKNESRPQRRSRNNNKRTYYRASWHEPPIDQRKWHGERTAHHVLNYLAPKMSNILVWRLSVEHSLHLYVCLFRWFLWVFLVARSVYQKRKKMYNKAVWVINVAEDREAVGEGRYLSYWSIYIDCWLPF